MCPGLEQGYSIMGTDVRCKLQGAFIVYDLYASKLLLLAALTVASGLYWECTALPEAHDKIQSKLIHH